MSEKEVRRDAMAFVDRMIANAEAEEWETADEFVVVTTNDETKALHLNGGFPDAVTALAWAEEHEEELNRGAPPTDDPFICTVYPMAAPQWKKAKEA